MKGRERERESKSWKNQGWRRGGQCKKYRMLRRGKGTRMRTEMKGKIRVKGEREKEREISKEKNYGTRKERL